MRHFHFPTSFKFGVADADLQVISESLTRIHENSQPTMWTHFAKTSGRVFQSETPERSVDRYTRWREDVDLIAALGVKHYRTSISMARMLTASGDPNAQAIEWYRAYFTALRDKGIRVYGTLYHWELPLTVHERGGWTNRDTVDLFARHCKIVARELGDLIDEYIVINEPWCVAAKGYHLGGHAPGERSVTCMLSAAHHLLLAIGAGFQEITSERPGALVSSSFNSEFAYARSAIPEDIKAAIFSDGYFNLWYLDPLYTGRYPEALSELYEQLLPPIGKADFDQIKIGPSLHALCINHYNSNVNVAAPRADDIVYGLREIGGKVMSHLIKYDNAPENDLEWPIFAGSSYGKGLYDMLLQVYHSYRLLGLKRIYITESGMALKTPWDGVAKIISDKARIAYYQWHLLQVYDLLRAKVPVEAFFAWTLMDNYEWEEGYRPEACFGLVHVDRVSLQRMVKESYEWYRRIATTHELHYDDALAFDSPALAVKRSKKNLQKR